MKKFIKISKKTKIDFIPDKPKFAPNEFISGISHNEFIIDENNNWRRIKILEEKLNEISGYIIFSPCKQIMIEK